MTVKSYTQHKSRYDLFPWQVQAYRQGTWHVISRHLSEARAVKGLAQIRKCQPDLPHLYRKVFCEADEFIWDMPPAKRVEDTPPLFDDPLR